MAVALLMLVTPADLEAHVRMLAETFSPRDHENPANLDRTASYIARELAAAGAEVSEQTYEASGEIYRNVIARIGPKTKERIVVGAHYDTCGPLPGADDNASGVAGLLALAKILAKDPPPLEVELVAYTLEEPPYFRTDRMGSAVHASAHKKNGVAVRAMIAIEMIGYFTNTPDSQQYPSALLKLFYPSTGHFIAVIGKLFDSGLTRAVTKAMREGTGELEVRSLQSPRFVPGIDFSDHASYWEQGYPAVMVTDTAFFRNTAYHTPDDTADRLDYLKMAQVVAGIAAAVRALASR